MNLEDHVGDIIRKARMMSNVSSGEAALAAGLAEPDLRKLEESGTCAARPSFKALAAVLGLDPGKLEHLAAGWLPAVPDLGRWREFRVITTDDGDMAVNAFLAWDEATREAALFDTGWHVKEVVRLVQTQELQLQHLFITHSHEDHIAALDGICRDFPQIRVHSSSRHAPVHQRNRPSDFIHLGSLRITHRDTPGHAEDGATYIIGNWPDDAPHVAIVGDAIFAGSMGRGNISWELARQKVAENILTLPLETLICPGHGPLTTVAEERVNNPFF